jgi:hypothetical protein
MKTMALLTVAAAMACSGQPGSDETTVELSVVKTRNLRANPQRHSGAVRSPLDLAAAAKAPGPLLTYDGGPVLQGVEVWAVFWGPNVVTETVSHMPDFLRSVSGDNPYMGMLSEYDSVTPAQDIDYGSFKGSVVDEDAPIPAGVLTDLQIQAELSRLIDIGMLPANNGKNLFFVFFPPNLSIQSNGLSCVDFCAYHSTFQRNGNDILNAAYNVYYGVMPDFTTGGCENPPGQTSGGCGFHASNLENLESATTHELVEAITDAAVGTSFNGFVAPLAWYDTINGEIGDICAFFPDGKTNGQVVQLEWSDEDRGCRDKRPPNNVVIDATPASLVVNAGATATLEVFASPPPSGTINHDPVKLSITNLPFTPNPAPVFTPKTIRAGEKAKLTFGVPADQPSQQLNFFVVGKDSNGEYHYVTPQLVVSTAAPAISRVTPNQGKTIGGDQVTITGSHLAPTLTAQIGVSGALEPAQVRVIQDPNTGAVTSAVVTTPGYPTAGKVQISLTNPDGNTATGEFTYVPSAPADAPGITGIDTPSGPLAGGTTVGIVGRNFGATAAVMDANGNSSLAAPTVTFGGAPAAVVGWDATTSTLSVVTPMVAAAGAVDVVVTNANGLASAPFKSFHYGPNPPPVLTNPALSATAGSTRGGTYVTIFGSSLPSAAFDPTATVTFGGVPARVTTANLNLLGVVTPPHAAGAVDVVVKNADGQTVTAAGAFAYQKGRH